MNMLIVKVTDAQGQHHFIQAYVKSSDKELVAEKIKKEFGPYSSTKPAIIGLNEDIENAKDKLTDLTGYNFYRLDPDLSL